MPEQSHYILAFGVPFRGRLPRRQQAACGVYVEAKQHIHEPSCPQWRAWLEQDAEKTAETFRALGYAQREDGVWMEVER